MAAFATAARRTALAAWTSSSAKLASTRSLVTHTLQIGEASSGRQVAYRQIPGANQPSIVYVPGLHSYSHMMGMASNCLLRFCDAHGHPCVTYDHECNGASPGGDIKKVIFTHWVEDVVEVVQKLTVGPVILVGLSMGGWLSLIAAQRIPQRIHGLVLYAPAMNYVLPYYNHHRAQLSAQTRARLDAGDIHVFAHAFGDALLKKDFAEDSKQYEVDFEKRIPLKCPVRIIHGLRDTEVLPKQSMKLCQALESEDVDIIFRKNGLHRAETLPDLELVLNTLDRLIKDYPV